MSKAIIRKMMTVTDEIHREMGREITPPTRRAAAIVVIENPFAGHYVEDLSELMEIGVELGTVNHAYTHFRVHVTIFATEIYGEPTLDTEWTGVHWLVSQEQPDYGLTGVTQKILTKLPWAGSKLLL